MRHSNVEGKLNGLQNEVAKANIFNYIIVRETRQRCDLQNRITKRSSVSRVLIATRNHSGTSEMGSKDY